MAVAIRQYLASGRARLRDLTVAAWDFPGSPTVAAALSPRRRALTELALLAVAYHAFLAMTGFGPFKAEYGAGVALLALLACGRAGWRELARQPAVLAFALFVAYLLLQTLYFGLDRAQPPLAQQLEFATKPIKLGLFACALGWWLAARPELVSWALRLMVAGLVLEVLLNLPGQDLYALFRGAERLRLGYSENILGVHVAIGLGLLVLMMAALYVRPKAPHRRPRLVLCLIGALVLILALILVQSRGAWLAAGLVIPLAVLGYWRSLDGGRAHRRLLRLTLLIAVIVGVSLWLFSGIVQHRLTGGGQIVNTVLSGQLDRVPMSSVGMRLHLLNLGLDQWADSPLLGRGLGSIRGLIEAGDIRYGDYVPQHLHNGYVQVLAATGLAGALLLAIVLFRLLRDLVDAYRTGQVDGATFWMLAAGLGIVLVANAFDYLLWHTGQIRVSLELLLGCGLAVSLRLRRHATAPAFAGRAVPASP